MVRVLVVSYCPVRVLFVHHQMTGSKWTCLHPAVFIFTYLTFVCRAGPKRQQTGAERISVSVWCVCAGWRCICKYFITYNDNSHLESFQSCQNTEARKKHVEEKDIVLCPPKKKPMLIKNIYIYESRLMPQGKEIKQQNDKPCALKNRFRTSEMIARESKCMSMFFFFLNQKIKLLQL